MAWKIKTNNFIRPCNFMTLEEPLSTCHMGCCFPACRIHRQKDHGALWPGHPPQWDGLSSLPSPTIPFPKGLVGGDLLSQLPRAAHAPCRGKSRLCPQDTGQLGSSPSTATGGGEGRAGRLRAFSWRSASTLEGPGALLCAGASEEGAQSALGLLLGELLQTVQGARPAFFRSSRRWRHTYEA